MNIMGKRKKNLKSKEKGAHIKEGYTKYVSTDGYKFWAKGFDDAAQYCKVMNWKLEGEYEEKKNI